MPNKTTLITLQKYEATAAGLHTVHNGDEIRPPLAQSPDGACSSAAVVPVVPAEDLEALWKPHRSYTNSPVIYVPPMENPGSSHRLCTL